MGLGNVESPRQQHAKDNMTQLASNITPLQTNQHTSFYAIYNLEM